MLSNFKRLSTPSRERKKEWMNHTQLGDFLSKRKYLQKYSEIKIAISKEFFF